MSTCATCDGAFFKNRDVAVVGSNAEAVDEALFLTRYARTVHVVSPKPRLDASPEMLAALEFRPQVRLMLGRRVVSIRGNGAVQGVRIAGPDGEHDLPVHGVFIFGAGSKPILGYLGDQAARNERGCLWTSGRMETRVPGVFACGDVICNEVQQAVVAAAQGCIAALGADKYLHGRKAFKKDYE